MTDPTAEQMRRAMVASQLRTNAVTDPRVLDAMGSVARDRFVPPERAAIAYSDVSVPIGNGRALSQPLVAGRLLTALEPRASDRALVIGAATGYSAALLAEIVGDVTALEEDPALIGFARAALPASVTVVEGPLTTGWADGAPYDLIDGAIAHVPDAIVAQLAEGGRLGTAIVEDGVTRLGSGRKAGGGFGLTLFADVETAILPGFARAKAFSF